jgi:hypothetical protein
MNKIFDWEDFKQFNVPPETLAAYCNSLVEERTTRVKLDPHCHDVVRMDAGFTEEYLANFPYTARMTRPVKDE